MLAALLQSLLYIGERDFQTRKEIIRRDIAKAAQKGQPLTQEQIEAKVVKDLPQLRTASGNISIKTIKTTASNLQTEATANMARNPYYLTGYKSGRNVAGTTIGTAPTTRQGKTVYIQSTIPERTVRGRGNQSYAVTKRTLEDINRDKEVYNRAAQTQAKIDKAAYSEQLQENIKAKQLYQARVENINTYGGLAPRKEAINYSNLSLIEKIKTKNIQSNPVPLREPQPQQNNNLWNLWGADEKVSKYTKKVLPASDKYTQAFYNKADRARDLARQNIAGFKKLDTKNLPTNIKGKVNTAKNINLLVGGVAANKYVNDYSKINTAFGTGLYEGVRQKPVTVGASLALSATGTLLISAAKYGALRLVAYAPVLAKGATAAKVVGTGGSLLLTGAYATSKGIEINAVEGRYNQASKVGQIVSSEIIPFAVGAKIGKRLAYPIEYRAGFEKGIQALPKKRQAAARTEFKELKGYLKAINKGSTKAKNLDFSAVEAGTSKANKITRKFLIANKKDVVVGGSLAQRTQIKDTSNLKLAGDIDAYTNKAGLAKSLAKELRAGGASARARGNKVYLTNDAGKSAKYIEFNALNMQSSGKTSLFSNIAKTRNVLSQTLPYKAGLTTTPEGITVTKLKVQAARKLYGGFEVGVDKLGRAKMGRYSKDIPSYRQIVEGTADFSTRNFNIFPTGTKAQFNIGGTISKPLNTEVGFSTLPKGKGGTSRALPAVKSGRARGGLYYNSIKVNPKTLNFYPSFKSKPSKPSGTYKPFISNPAAPPVPSKINKPYPVFKSDSVTPRPFNPTRQPPPPTRREQPYIPFTSKGRPPPITTNPVPIITKTNNKNRDFGFDIPESKPRKPKKKQKKTLPLVDFTPKYFASVEATFFNIKGKKPSKNAIAMGLDIRPITR